MSNLVTLKCILTNDGRTITLKFSRDSLSMDLLKKTVQSVWGITRQLGCFTHYYRDELETDGDIQGYVKHTQEHFPTQGYVNLDFTERPRPVKPVTKGLPKAAKIAGKKRKKPRLGRKGKLAEATKRVRQISHQHEHHTSDSSDLPEDRCGFSIPITRDSPMYCSHSLPTNPKNSLNVNAFDTSNASLNDLDGLEKFRRRVLESESMCSPDSSSDSSSDECEDEYERCQICSRLGLVGRDIFRMECSSEECSSEECSSEECSSEDISNNSSEDNSSSDSDDDSDSSESLDLVHLGDKYRDWKQEMNQVWKKADELMEEYNEEEEVDYIMTSKLRVRLKQDYK
jgi:hypothetical protein